MVQNILSKVLFNSGFKLVKFKHSDVYTEFILLIGGIAKRKQSWARRVRTVAYSYLVINSHKYIGATP